MICPLLPGFAKKPENEDKCFGRNGIRISQAYTYI
jgi:hypothetical protein